LFILKYLPGRPKSPCYSMWDCWYLWIVLLNVPHFVAHILESSQRVRRDSARETRPPSSINQFHYHWSIEHNQTLLLALVAERYSRRRRCYFQNTRTTISLSMDSSTILPSPYNTIPSPTTLLNSPYTPSPLIRVVSPVSISPTTIGHDEGPAKKKQKRNKPTLSCEECVERKTKVSFQQSASAVFGSARKDVQFQFVSVADLSIPVVRALCTPPNHRIDPSTEYG
jgi:hypothetical protein